jgi:ABC-type ATPase involved in cell division
LPTSFARWPAGADLLIATHDEDFAQAAATRILHVHEGRVLPSAGEVTWP